MSQGPRIAVTADTHWGHHARGDDAVTQLAAHLYADPPDALVIAGDVGTGERFAECLALFAGLPCPKALVPGNHDLWVRPDDPRGDSLAVYERHLPAACAASGFHYLDSGPLSLPGAGLALVGTVNWYDYTWSAGELGRRFPGDEWRLAAKWFTRGRHNDGVFVRWPLDDPGFTDRVVGSFARHLDGALSLAPKVVAVAHHPPFRGLAFPNAENPPSLDALLWAAFTGNQGMEDLLARHAGRIPAVFCGHTHRARAADLGRTRGYNVGGDYHFKRLLLYDAGSGGVEARQFGDPGR